MLFLRLFVLYFGIGTMCLLMFLFDVFQLTMVRKRDGKVFKNPTLYVVALCFYWPFIFFLIFKGGNHEDKDS